MLNITHNSIQQKVRTGDWQRLAQVENRRSGVSLMRLLAILSVIGLIILFLPWTQNIRAGGQVTALQPDQRPQTLHSVIPGRIEKWFVSEGDLVRKGDTILYISEVKDEYFDPDLLANTKDQLAAKEQSVTSYMEKVRALDQQFDALLAARELKIQQAENKLRQAGLKIASDSIDLVAAEVQYKIAKDQYVRMQELQQQGLKSLTDLENRKAKMQEAEAKMISQENKLLTSRNEAINAQVEITTLDAEYRDKMAKVNSEKFAAMSSMYDAEATVTKLQNTFMNYSVRTGLYYITAPQDGYITKAIQTGIGETIKEGEELLSIMPANPELAAEVYIEPMDLPLLSTGQHIRMQFDGWPAVVFSGWPDMSVGTYGGSIVAIDNFISTNGKYRILVAPDPDSDPWPDGIRVGSGVSAMALLKDVPIWYELWRKVNGFPPDFYRANESGTSEKKK
ncbi:MAG: HlyD family efflux transporter periplasmic adaptor subunit [Chitinophagales bacterium]|nr:HlyD family efflux transporter periplasmic adaptor subunit [Chitinophagales bacterium]HAE35391.1 biotin attachment protein [Bacteroidota bacterium]HPR28754.1 HlyD family efflux transporter periplasmic adaptor subunit [Chitinophagales bacterium]